MTAPRMAHITPRELTCLLPLLTHSQLVTFSYVYFEKVRILEGKKKTPKRLQNEVMQSNGFPLINPPKYVWGPR
jgi:hypothetical protein